MENRTPFATSGPFAPRMDRRALLLMMGLLVPPLGCGVTEPDMPLVLLPSEFCSDHSDDAIPTFEDALLGEATLEAVNWSVGDFLGVPLGQHTHLTCGLISGLETLVTDFLQIGSLVGSQNLTGLSYLSLYGASISDLDPLSSLTGLGSLELGDNSITDISALSGLTNLENLSLSGNSISDIGPLSGVTGLVAVSLDKNSITDIGALSGLTDLTAVYLGGNRDLSNIQPLLDNTGVGAGDLVDLIATNVSCTDVAALEAKGVSVTSDCP